MWRDRQGVVEEQAGVSAAGGVGLSLAAPWAITPLLMMAAFICALRGRRRSCTRCARMGFRRRLPCRFLRDPTALEEQKVRSAIQTDLILSGEIMAITLGTVPEAGFAVQAAVLAVVGTGITALVYGAVALIVKADDAGLALSRAGWPPAGVRPLGARGRAGMVLGMRCCCGCWAWWARRRWCGWAAASCCTGWRSLGAWAGAPGARAGRRSGGCGAGGARGGDVAGVGLRWQGCWGWRQGWQWCQWRAAGAFGAAAAPTRSNGGRGLIEADERLGHLALWMRKKGGRQLRCDRACVWVVSQSESKQTSLGLRTNENLSRLAWLGTAEGHLCDKPRKSA